MVWLNLQAMQIQVFKSWEVGLQLPSKIRDGCIIVIKFLKMHKFGFHWNMHELGRKPEILSPLIPSISQKGPSLSSTPPVTSISPEAQFP